MKKIIVVIIILLIGISSMAVWGATPIGTRDNANSGIYNDVPKDHWAYDAIIFLTELAKERNQSMSEVVQTLMLEMRERLQNDEDYRIRYIENFREICKNDENMMRSMFERLGIEYQPEMQGIDEGE